MRTRNLVMALTTAMSLCLATGLVGCSDDDGGNNNNNVNDNTTGDHLSDEMMVTPAGDPDFTCEGETDPALVYTMETEISGIVKDFEKDWAVESVLVSVYESVDDLLDDNPYDTSAESAPNGSYTVLAPPNVQRLHFKIWDPTFTDYFVTVELNEPVAGMPPGPPQSTGKDRLVISAVTMEVVPAILGIQRIEGRGIVSGRVYDCKSDELRYAAMRAYDGPASDPDRQLLSLYEGPYRNAFYFPEGGSIPGKDPMFTDPEGRFIVANLIATPGEFVTMEFWGRYATCPDGCLVSTQEIPVLPDSIVVTDMLPLYAE
jgi:hypothetical protein